MTENVLWRNHCARILVKAVIVFDNNLVVDSLKDESVIIGKFAEGVVWGSNVRRNILFHPNRRATDSGTLPPTRASGIRTKVASSWRRTRPL